ncbi:hypothetical protein Tco_1001151 [Tanacetum coccineum]
MYGGDVERLSVARVGRRLMIEVGCYLLTGLGDVGWWRENNMVALAVRKSYRVSYGREKSQWDAFVERNRDAAATKGFLFSFDIKMSFFYENNTNYAEFSSSTLPSFSYQVILSLLHSNGYVHDFSTNDVTNKLEALVFVHPVIVGSIGAFPVPLDLQAGSIRYSVAGSVQLFL